MKTRLLTLLLFATAAQLLGQDAQPGTQSKDTGAIAQIAERLNNPPSQTHDEIGINFTSFLDEAIDFGGENTTLNPYLFTYKRLNESGDGFRLGAGFSLSRSKGDLSGNFFIKDAKTATSAIDLRMGSEQQRRISNRWVYYYGFDGLIGFSTTSIKTNDTKIENSRLYGGLGPVLGAQFMLTDRVGLFTEASFYLVQSFDHEKTDFSNNFQDDEKNDSNSTSLNFQVPTNIYLFFKF
jgi:hypothetical protein